MREREREKRESRKKEIWFGIWFEAPLSDRFKGFPSSLRIPLFWLDCVFPLEVLYVELHENMFNLPVRRFSVKCW